MNDLTLLTDEEVAALSDDELDIYIATLEALDDDWVLTPKQAEADRLADTVNELMYGGAAGGGKSDFDLWHANKWSKKIKGHRTLILRTKFPELRRTLIYRSIQKFRADVTACGPQMEPAHYKVADKEWHYANGSVIEFGFCETDEDVRQYLSAEYDLLIIDESTDMTGEQIELLRSRLRTTRRKKALGCRPHMVLSTNPGGVGHAWHKERYVEATYYGGRVAETLDDPNDPDSVRRVAFVRSLPFDNPHLDPQYIRELQALTNPVKKAQYLEGSWDVFEGQFFTEWNRDLHVIPWFPIPEGWPRVRAIDFGIGAPFCALWLAFDEDGWAYVYRELYGPGNTATEQAKMVLAASKLPDGRPEDIDYTVADPSIWARTGSGLSVAMQYRQAGLICRKAMNARVDGWSRTRDFLRGSKDPTSPNFGIPGLRILEGMAPNLVRTIPLMLHSDSNPEDVNTKLEDHAPDALRYGLMSRPRHAERPKQDPDRSTAEPRAGDDIEEMLRDRDRNNHPVLGRLG